jgi:hypothetical protein
MATRADGPHLEAQPAQGGPGLGGVEVEHVEAGRSSEDLLDRVQLRLDLDGMLPNRSETALTHRANDVRPAQPEPLPAHHQIDGLGVGLSASLAERQYTNHPNHPTTQSRESEMSFPHERTHTRLDRRWMEQLPWTSSPDPRPSPHPDHLRPGSGFLERPSFGVGKAAAHRPPRAW